jgi:hypothetical protein
MYGREEHAANLEMAFVLIVKVELNVGVDDTFVCNFEDLVVENF